MLRKTQCKLCKLGLIDLKLLIFPIKQPVYVPPNLRKDDGFDRNSQDTKAVDEKSDMDVPRITKWRVMKCELRRGTYRPPTDKTFQIGLLISNKVSKLLLNI